MSSVIRPFTCPLCEASCGVLVEVRDREAQSVRGDALDAHSKGYLCPKAAALVDLQHDPDRLTAPMIREGERFREAGWDEAFAVAADGLARARDEHGRDAVGVYYGNPTVHNVGLLTHTVGLARALRTRNVYSASSLDQLPQMLASYLMYGHVALLPVPDVDRTQLFVVLGANPLVSNGSIMTAPDMRGRLRALRERGGRLVVIDPRRSETAEIADEHLRVRPGSDALLLAAMLQVIFAEKLARLGRLEGKVRGEGELRALVRDLTPARVAGATRIAAPEIAALARRFAQTERAVLYGRVGMCHQRLGTIAAWLVQALDVVTGHADDVGGAMLTTPAVDFVSLITRLGMRGSYGAWRTRVRGLPEVAGEAPTATLADEIETPGEGQLRALLVVAGNPVLSAPNGRRLDRALATLDHMVAVDPYLNETTRHARVILPPCGPLSRPHQDLALHAFAVRNFVKFSEAPIPRADHERLDWEILAELGARTLAPKALRAVAAAAARRARPEIFIDLLLRAGPHDVTLADLRAAPHGIDLGPLRPGALARAIATDDRKVHLAPPELLAEARRELPALADAPAHEARSELLLIGRRHLRSNNSWLHNAKRLVKGPPRCTLLVHPDDARRLGLSDGATARVSSDAGSVTAPVEISDEVAAGVVSLPHGWGHDRDGARLSIAREHAGVSANDVTSERFLDGMTGTAAFNGLPVRVERA